MKVVDYFGLEVCIPDWANYIAKDSNGELWYSNSKPVYLEWSGYWMNLHSDGVGFLMSGVTLDCTPKQSLMKAGEILNEYCN